VRLDRFQGCVDPNGAEKLMAAGFPVGAWLRRRVTTRLLEGLILLSVVLIPTASLAQTVKIGDVAPDFTVQSLDGKRSIHLSDFRGRRVLIYTWASW